MFGVTLRIGCTIPERYSLSFISPYQYSWRLYLRVGLRVPVKSSTGAFLCKPDKAYAVIHNQIQQVMSLGHT